MFHNALLMEQLARYRVQELHKPHISTSLSEGSLPRLPLWPLFLWQTQR